MITIKFSFNLTIMVAKKKLGDESQISGPYDAKRLWKKKRV
jgi:hypothetical protein